MRFWRNSYTSRAERKGLLGLTALVFLISSYRFFRPTIEEWSLEVEELEALIDERESRWKEEEATKEPVPDGYVVRDVNDMDSASWVSLGFTPRQAITIVNYGRMRGGYYSPTDLLSCFVIDSTRLTEIDEYIRYSMRPVHDAPSIKNNGVKDIDWKIKKPEFRGEQMRNESIVVELNSASLNQLDSINGIGPFYANKIIRYRDKLGGYFDVHQLEEAGLPDSLCVAVQASLIIDQDEVEQLEINSASYHELKKHPYITNHLALKIVESRYNQGTFVRLEELMERGLVSQGIYVKIAPYLKTKEQSIN